ncbi:MAG TPA: hypothetical protein VNI77_11105 [Nitrososphaera sp.]|nr:hypothetical protein [Nitrososphaera sp.]
MRRYEDGRKNLGDPAKLSIVCGNADIHKFLAIEFAEEIDQIYNRKLLYPGIDISSSVRYKEGEAMKSPWV